MAMLPMTLRLEAENGLGAEEYRVYEGGIEVRRLQIFGEREPGLLSEGEPDDAWRRLSPAELTQHVKNKTVVAQWLQHRIGWRRLLHACSNPETLQEFGISENTLDRYAA